MKLSKKYVIGATLSILCINVSAQKVPYKDASLSIEERVEDLLKRMTIEEKVYQMCAIRLGEGDEIFKTSGKYNPSFVKEQMGSHGIGHVSCPTSDMDASNSVKTINAIQKIAVENTRLGIPVIVNDEALHGIKGKGATSYPQAIALSCTWDLELMGRIGKAIGEEAADRGIRQVLSPTLDLARDPRHGRMEETYGEDPLLAGLFGKEYIKGVQSHGIICSPKHFVANFVGEGGRDSKNISISERELREIHLLPFQMAIKEAKAKSIMAAYNAIDGIPCHANRWLLTDILRDEWGFKGYTVSDWSGVPHICNMHHATSSIEEAAIRASISGLDVDLPRIKTFKTLIESVKKNKIAEKDIDENVRRILRTKFELGLFESPYIKEKSKKEQNIPEKYRSLALEAAEKSIVMLKNDGILPIKEVSTIAVIGPNADKLQLGGYSSIGVTGPTPYKAIAKEFSGKTILYAKGCNLKDSDRSGFKEAIETAKKSDICIMVMGGQDWVTGGETNDRTTLKLMGVQEELIENIANLNKPIIVVLIDGRPVKMTKWKDKVNGIFMMFYGGEEGGTALAEILSGKVNPSGKLTVTIPQNVGQLPMPLMNRPYGREGNFADSPLNNDIPYRKTNRYNPLYPFGYGLSYSTFKYSDIEMSKESLSSTDTLHVSIDITNASSTEGDEIIQLYLTDECCRISPYTRVLKQFHRINLKAGQTKTVTFDIPYKEFSFLNESFIPEVESGFHEIFIGRNSLDGTSEKVELKENHLYK